MRLVIAIGGNALEPPAETLDIASQRASLKSVARALAEIATEHEVIVTHGNGPQIGKLALQANTGIDSKQTPLDVLGAQSQGLLGYLIIEALTNEINCSPAALLTRVLVNSDDPAFAEPKKPIGPYYSAVEARTLQTELGWRFIERTRGWRRVVASPLPTAIVDLEPIRALVAQHHVVVCAGGGGIPVVRRDEEYLGVEAVVDKDRTAAVLGGALDASALIVLTDVSGVLTRWPEPDSPMIRLASPRHFAGETFEAGSMRPKLEAVCEFVAANKHSTRDPGERWAAIGHLSDLARIVQREAGTIVERSVEQIRYD